MKMSSAVFSLALIVGACSSHAQTGPPLTLEKTLKLPEGAEKFDHFAIDLKANRLFIAATGSHTIQVIDLNTGEVNAPITGLGKPHGLAWISESNRLYASDGAQADLKSYEGSPLQLTKSFRLSDDADDMVYDPKSQLLYVGHGGGNSESRAGIAVVGTNNQSLVANLRVSAHPEGLEIDHATGRIFANIADTGEIVLIDGATYTQLALWKLNRAKDNVPLAYDGEDQLLFVGCRAPARLVILDGRSGKELADLPSDAGADDLFYDAERHRIYLIAGSGAIDVYEVSIGKVVHSIGTVHTPSGAKTGLLVPSQHTLYVGAPAVGSKQAEILVYKTSQ